MIKLIKQFCVSLLNFLRHFVAFSFFNEFSFRNVWWKFCFDHRFWWYCNSRDVRRRFQLIQYQLSWFIFLARGRVWARFRCLLSTLILSDFESMLFAHAISRYPCNSELQIWSIAAHLAISCSFLLLTVCQEGRTRDWLIICRFHRLWFSGYFPQISIETTSIGSY